jgi:hypothetical protein
MPTSISIPREYHVLICTRVYLERKIMCKKQLCFRLVVLAHRARISAGGVIRPSLSCRRSVLTCPKFSFGKEWLVASGQAAALLHTGIDNAREFVMALVGMRWDEAGMINYSLLPKPKMASSNWLRDASFFFIYIGKIRPAQQAGGASATATSSFQNRRNIILGARTANWSAEPARSCVRKACISRALSLVSSAMFPGEVMIAIPFPYD